MLPTAPGLTHVTVATHGNRTVSIKVKLGYVHPLPLRVSVDAVGPTIRYGSALRSLHKLVLRLVSLRIELNLHRYSSTPFYSHFASTCRRSCSYSRSLLSNTCRHNQFFAKHGQRGGPQRGIWPSLATITSRETTMPLGGLSVFRQLNP